MPKLTKIRVDRLKPSDKQAFAWCGELPGFGVRVTPGGVKSFVYQYRPRGRSPKRLTIGRYGELTADEARDIAGDYARAVRRGETPGPRLADGPTWPEVVIQYADRHLAKRSERHRRETMRVLRNYFPKLERREFATVTRTDIFDVVDRFETEDKAGMARGVYRAAYGLFSWAVDRQLIDANPLSGVKPPKPSKPRQRALADEEVAILWPALTELGYPYGPWAKLLLLTGQRTREVAGIRRSEIDGNVWTLPGERSKNGEPNTVYLSPLAMEVIEEINHEHEHLLTTTGEAPLRWFSAAKVKVDRLVNLPHWTWHDLRRTFATGMAELGVEPHIIEECLGHKSGHKAGVAGVYNRAQYREPKRRAFEVWGAHLAKLMTGEGAEIVPLHGNRK